MGTYSLISSNSLFFSLFPFPSAVTGKKPSLGDLSERLRKFTKKPLKFKGLLLPSKEKQFSTSAKFAQGGFSCIRGAEKGWEKRNLGVISLFEKKKNIRDVANGISQFRLSKNRSQN